MLCYAMLCYAMLCYAMLCYVMLCYVMLCYVMLCYVMLCHVKRKQKCISVFRFFEIAFHCNLCHRWPSFLRFFFNFFSSYISTKTTLIRICRFHNSLELFEILRPSLKLAEIMGVSLLVCPSELYFTWWSSSKFSTFGSLRVKGAVSATPLFMFISGAVN